jgi:hypothetical protein
MFQGPESVTAPDDNHVINSKVDLHVHACVETNGEVALVLVVGSLVLCRLLLTSLYYFYFILFWVVVGDSGG